VAKTPTTPAVVVKLVRRGRRVASCLTPCANQKPSSELRNFEVILRMERSESSTPKNPKCFGIGKHECISNKHPVESQCKRHGPPRFLRQPKSSRTKGSPTRGKNRRKPCRPLTKTIADYGGQRKRKNTQPDWHCIIKPLRILSFFSGRRNRTMVLVRGRRASPCFSPCR